MVSYEKEILKKLQKRQLPEKIFLQFDNAFQSLAITKDLSLFDIKKLKSGDERAYFRLRKGQYRAIFYLEKERIFVVALDKREEVYKKWQ